MFTRVVSEVLRESCCRRRSQRRCKLAAATTTHVVLLHYWCCSRLSNITVYRLRGYDSEPGRNILFVRLSVFANEIVKYNHSPGQRVSRELCIISLIALLMKTYKSAISTILRVRICVFIIYDLPTLAYVFHVIPAYARSEDSPPFIVFHYFLLIRN